MDLRNQGFVIKPHQQYAVQLRATPQLLEALLSGQQASIRFGERQEDNAVTVGDTSFGFTSSAQEGCDLLHVPASGGGGDGAAAVVAALRHKLMVRRSVEQERDRVRARAEEAERKQGERRLLLLSKKPAPSRSKSRTTQRVTPPPPEPAAKAAVPARPPVVPRAAPAPYHQPTQPQPPLPAAAAAAKPFHESASAPKLKAKPSSSAAASDLVVAATRHSGLRLCLIAALYERPLPRPAVTAIVESAAARVRAFKMPTKQELERVLKSVAEYKSPGIYVVREWLRRDLETAGLLSPGTAGGQLAAAGGGSSREPSPQFSKPAGAGAPGGPGQQHTGSKRQRDESTPEAEGQQQGPPKQRGRQQSKGSMPLADATPSPAPPSAASPPLETPGSRSSLPTATGSGAHPHQIMRNTSSSNGSQQGADSWVDEHASRQPEHAAPVRSKQEFYEAERAFNEKYSLYFKLHQLLSSHRKDVAAMQQSAKEALTQAERERLELDLERMRRKRGERVSRWDAAYRVLHAELAEAKAQMAEFVRFYARQANDAGGGSGPTAVRVP